jgi:hypothetical protein
MKISASERMYETSLGVSDDMHELFTAVHEPRLWPTETSSPLKSMSAIRGRADRNGSG